MLLIQICESSHGNHIFYFLKIVYQFQLVKTHLFSHMGATMLANTSALVLHEPNRFNYVLIDYDLTNPQTLIFAKPTTPCPQQNPFMPYPTLSLVNAPQQHEGSLLINFFQNLLLLVNTFHCTHRNLITYNVLQFHPFISMYTKQTSCHDNKYSVQKQYFSFSHTRGYVATYNIHLSKFQGSKYVITKKH